LFDNEQHQALQELGGKRTCIAIVSLHKTSYIQMHAYNQCLSVLTKVGCSLMALSTQISLSRKDVQIKWKSTGNAALNSISVSDPNTLG